jgi:hypothetical protein
MSKWVKGQSGNLKGRPKTAYLESFDTIRAKREMMGEATQILRERWQEVVHAMIDAAIEGNPQAASFICNYVIGKPKEIIEHDISDSTKKAMQIVIDKSENDL